ncbi:Lipopolysaccharide-induced tumor necrosis factor-alpha factor [Orchesella cincta]|uniref:Lipopolysaccharide-induced tumor necrosis factor-alpha factor n=1 Tax=Orchesella cincta TaxID=48709 RepID=A0A1D2MMP1_ORCCI|nr:Lipopolysaccharide-induced tumor necrosis factor-alpha factor [Orchesella cincta]
MSSEKCPEYFSNPTLNVGGGGKEKQMPIPQPAAPATIIVPQIALSSELGSNSIRTICSECGRDIITNTQKKPSEMSMISACMAIFCCGALACCVPFCMGSDDCVDTKHSCPHCGNVVGTNAASSC